VTLLKRTNSLGDVWEYTTGTIYKNSVPYQMSMPEGRVTYANGNWANEFECRDIWGNLRVGFKANNGQLETTQRNEYDITGFELKPLGLEDISSRSNWKFQNQERIADFDLDIDFFKFRPSDSKIARFWHIDPLSSDYPYNSPYAFQENKFGSGIELEGKELFPWANVIVSQEPIVVRPVVENVVKTGTELGKVSETSVPKIPKGRFTPEQLEKFAEGRKIETEQLAKHGYDKNNKPFEVNDPKTGEKGTTVPDALKPDGGTVEVKHVKYQGLEKQLRLQKEISEAAGVKPELIINQGARISKPVKEAFDIKYYSKVVSQGDATQVVNNKVNILRVNPCANNPDCL
jgi:hypothetical protein